MEQTSIFKPSHQYLFNWNKVLWVIQFEMIFNALCYSTYGKYTIYNFNTFFLNKSIYDVLLHLLKMKSIKIKYVI